MNRLFILAFIIVVFSFSSSVAQYQFPKFDKITPLDLKSNWQREYPYAEAVILQDYGEVQFDIGSTPKVRYTFHRRVKVLNEAGLSYAEVRIPIVSKTGRKIRIQKIQAATYRLNSANKVMKADVSKRNLAENEINEQLTEYSFKFPLAEVGAILEYTYTYLDDDLQNIKPWKFQHKVPLVISEYHTYFPGSFHYLQLSSGDLSEVKIDRESYRQRIGNISTQARLNSLANNPGAYDVGGPRYASVRGVHSRYVIEDQPPVTVEPHIQSIEDYIPSVKFYLSGNMSRRSMASFQNLQNSVLGRRSSAQYGRSRNSTPSEKITRKSELLDLSRLPHELPGFRWLDIPGTSHKQQARNWNSLSKDLLRDANFGKQIDKYELLAQRGSRLARRHEDPERKARAIYENVRKRMVWDGTYGLYVDELDKAYTTKKGSGATVNFILLNMLRGAGLNAYPVVLRTRDEGGVLHMLPNIETFNHAVVVVQLPDQIALLDATSRVVSFGMLPEYDLNLLGFAVDKEEWGWVQINPEDVFSRTCGSFNMESDGKLKGKFEVTHTEYSAAIERGRWLVDSLQNDDYLQQYVLSGLQDREVLDYQVQYLEDTERPFIITCDLETSAFAEIVDDYMFVSPMMTRMITQNPFPPTTRLYPISFPAPTRDYYLFGMKVPEGYEVAQMPSPIFVRLGQNGGAFVYNVFLDGEYLFITSAIHLAQTYFNSRAYSELTNFFDYVVSKHSEDIVLKKVEEVN